ncbi:polysaccharide deacetylase family protein [Kitasatospora sp. NPDC059795]|uniref:polysaccharide deacetylase family protein n=1 Tax=Kitasatospora sp. NPDC059795 TaxID=3346949 RepID=UPI003651B274
MPTKNRDPRPSRRRHLVALTALTALASLAVGCSSLRTEDDAHAAPPAARPAAGQPAAGQPAAGQPAAGQPVAAQPAVAFPQAAAGQELNGRLGAAERESRQQQAELAAARRWGLAALPLKAPAAPAEKPELVAGPNVLLADGLPPVVRRVPTEDDVVFLTVDDGAEKDPEFAAMVEELGVPLSVFLSDYLARSDYDYFRDLRDHGVGVYNHTINHPDLRRLGGDALQREICGQQDRLEQEIGARPRLFRPPYGEYTAAALRTAASCGVTAVALWTEEAFPDHLEYRYSDAKLHPGDIILTHFRAPAAGWKGTLSDMLRRVIDTATAEGFAIGRLEDYL